MALCERKKHCFQSELESPSPHTTMITATPRTPPVFYVLLKTIAVKFYLIIREMIQKSSNVVPVWLKKPMKRSCMLDFCFYSGVNFNKIAGPSFVGNVFTVSFEEETL